MLQGSQLIDGVGRTAGQKTFRTHEPHSGARLDPVFQEATSDEMAEAVASAAACAADLRGRSTIEIARLLETIADRLDAEHDALVARADAESGLGATRLSGEVRRTSDQFRLFARVAREGSHLGVIIDHHEPDATPPRPDLRRMAVPVGPVAVFGASNFPLAFGAAGGDTASALAAGCPVIVKAHPSNAGTSELAARVLASAVEDTGFPSGAFALLQGSSHQLGEDLVSAPPLAAVGFTGSLAGGRALSDLAAARPNPIPVYAEMGSANPVWVLPTALERRSEEIATDLVASVTQGSGQFCTKPGLAFVPDGPRAVSLLSAIEERIEGLQVGPLLDERIAQAFKDRTGELEKVDGVHVIGRAPESTEGGWRGTPTVLTCDVDTWTREELLQEECFGPIAVVVTGAIDELLGAAAEMSGSLTATIHAEPEDREIVAALAPALIGNVGRLIYNEYPTGVAVTWAMHHGGPYPSTTAPLHTSVGAMAVSRFLRPVVYQNVPNELLPPPLQARNPWQLPRRIDGHLQLAK